MDSNSLLTIENRMHKLERQVRNFKIAFFLLLVGFIVTIPISNAGTTRSNDLSDQSILKPANVPVVNSKFGPNDRVDLRLKKKNARFGTLEVDKLIIKDESGQKTLLFVGRNKINVSDGGEGTVVVQSGIITLTNNKFKVRKVNLNSEQVSVTSEQQSVVSINSKNLTTKSRVGRNSVAASGMNVSRNGKSLITIKTTGSDGSAIYLKSAGKNYNLTMQAEGKGTSKGAFVNVANGQTGVRLGIAKAGVGLLVENKAKSTSLSVALAEDATPSVILKSK